MTQAVNPVPTLQAPVMDRAAAPGASMRARDGAFAKSLAQVQGHTSPIGGARTVQVSEGDTLSGIVARHLRLTHAGLPASQVFRLALATAKDNGIANPNMIVPGQNIDLSNLQTHLQTHLQSQLQTQLQAPVQTPAQSRIGLKFDASRPAWGTASQGRPDSGAIHAHTAGASLDRAPAPQISRQAAIATPGASRPPDSAAASQAVSPGELNTAGSAQDAPKLGALDPRQALIRPARPEPWSGPHGQAGQDPRTSPKSAVVGDSIALGLGKSLLNRSQVAPVLSERGNTLSHQDSKFAVQASGSLNSSQILKAVRDNPGVQGSDIAVISVSTNDLASLGAGGDRAAKRVADQVAEIRSTMQAKEYIWVLPYDPRASRIVRSIARQHGDGTLDLQEFQTSDKYHPNSYAAISKRLQPLFENTAAQAARDDRVSAARPAMGAQAHSTLDVLMNRHLNATVPTTYTLSTLNRPRLDRHYGL